MKCWPAIIAICVLVGIETTADYVAIHAAVASKPAQSKTSWIFANVVHYSRSIIRKLKNILYFVEEKSVDNLCLTAECNQTASRILRNMNPSVDPCENFYNFACGGFINSTTIPDHKDIVDAVTVIEEKLQGELKKIIEDIEPNASKPYTLVKTLYNNCMNTEAIKLQSLDSFRNFLTERGGWPVLDGDTWNENKSKTGLVIDYFSNFNIRADVKNDTKHIMTITIAEQGLSRAYLSNGFNDDKVQAYYNYMVNVSVILGANVNRSKSELKESLLFEIDMAKEIRNYDKFFTTMTIKQLMNNYSTLPWMKYFTWHLSPVVDVCEDDIVIVPHSTYIANMEKLINKTPKRVQANYAMWITAGKYAEFLTEDIRKCRRDFNTLATGVYRPTVRWEECMDSVHNWLNLGLNAIYLKQHANPSIKSDVTEIVTNAKEQFDEMLQQAEWLDDETRRFARNKLERMSSNIAYHDEHTLGKELEDYYQNLELSDGIYFRSVYNLTQFNKRHMAGKLRKSFKRNDWINHGNSLGVDAHYYINENVFDLSATILQGDFYNIARPKYINYGAIGFPTGHEFAHAFGGIGKYFDEHGQLSDWWTSSTEEKFLKQAECINHQYGNYTVDAIELNINGINTQVENIADNGGLKAAYRAYIKWAAIRIIQEERLSGLPYTPKQMFWISAANSWCSKTRPKILKDDIETGVHSPDEFRIIGPFSNMPEFSKDFNCKIGSNMNPVKKCTVW